MELFGFKNLDELVGFNCAPVLSGIKPANLFSLRPRDLPEIKEHLEAYNKLFSGRGIVFRNLCSCGRRVLIFVYDEEKLSDLLHEKGHRSYLVAIGYDRNALLEEDLQMLEHRLRASEVFPHEIGIFLGYPLEDVLGFVLNKGAKSKYSGYWKVYGDVEKARGMFVDYEKCRSCLLEKLSKGLPLHQAVLN